MLASRVRVQVLLGFPCANASLSFLQHDCYANQRQTRVSTEGHHFASLNTTQVALPKGKKKTHDMLLLLLLVIPPLSGRSLIKGALYSRCLVTEH